MNISMVILSEKHWIFDNLHQNDDKMWKLKFLVYD